MDSMRTLINKVSAPSLFKELSDLGDTLNEYSNCDQSLKYSIFEYNRYSSRYGYRYIFINHSFYRLDNV